MSQVADETVGRAEMDPFEIGWYVESADEETYGPISRKALRRLLEEETITPNTLIRHCTQPEAKPAAEEPGIMERLSLETSRSAVGDRLSESWPRKTRDRQALAEDSLPCAWHRRPAVLVCVRCHAPYCNKCRAKPFRKHYFLCRRCQLRVYNKRIAALMLDTAVFLYVPIFGVAGILALLGMSADAGMTTAVIYLVNFLAVCAYLWRDSLFRGAGPGKLATALRVVQTKDGTSPLTHGQGFVRWLSQFIPIFNLIDASVPYRDPLLRRYGDRWAGTRVIDTELRLAQVRQKIARRLVKKGVQPARQVGMTMEGLARLV
jgi:uncharacterized RDD family membrane protein YckC